MRGDRERWSGAHPPVVDACSGGASSGGAAREKVWLAALFSLQVFVGLFSPKKKRGRLGFWGLIDWAPECPLVQGGATRWLEVAVCLVGRKRSPGLSRCSSHRGGGGSGRLMSTAGASGGQKRRSLGLVWPEAACRGRFSGLRRKCLRSEYGRHWRCTGRAMEEAAELREMWRRVLGDLGEFQ